MLADARRPEEYCAVVGCADILYQDVSQRDQLDIFAKNADRMLAPGGTGIVMLKARSIDSSLRPQKIYQDAIGELARRGCRVLDVVELDPFQKDHAAIVVKKNVSRTGGQA